MRGTIRPMEDLGSPAVVTLVDQITLEAAPEYNEWAAYGLTAIGYIGGFMGFGGGFVKNLGVASLPLTVRHIRERFRTERRATAPSRMAFRPAAASAYRGRPVSQTPGPGFDKLETY